MEPTHTPGPWAWGTDHAGRTDLLGMQGRIVLEHDYFVICESDADAKLIAAAPELLEALIKMVYTFSGSDPLREGNAVLANALAAIKKATQ